MNLINLELDFIPYKNNINATPLRILDAINSNTVGVKRIKTIRIKEINPFSNEIHFEKVYMIIKNTYTGCA